MQNDNEVIFVVKEKMIDELVRAACDLQRYGTTECMQKYYEALVNVKKTTLEQYIVTKLKNLQNKSPEGI